MSLGELVSAGVRCAMGGGGVRMRSGDRIGSLKSGLGSECLRMGQLFTSTVKMAVDKAQEGVRGF